MFTQLSVFRVPSRILGYELTPPDNKLLGIVVSDIFRDV